MTGGLGAGAIVTTFNSPDTWWSVTGYDDVPGVGRRVHLCRWLPDAWVRVRAGEPWWEYTDTDTVRAVWWFQLGAVVLPAVSPWPVGVS